MRKCNEWTIRMPDSLVPDKMTRDKKISVASASRFSVVAENVQSKLTSDGFVIIKDFVTKEELHEVVIILDSLYEKFGSLPKSLAFDLGDIKYHDGRLQIPEINKVASLAPIIKETAFYKKALDLSRQICGDKAAYIHDHAIYKAPFNDKETPWHQDEAGSYGRFLHMNQLHWWLPLQASDQYNGAMQYVPQSHLGRVFPHHKRNYDKRSHALQADVVTDDVIKPSFDLGSVGVHLPRTLHYTGPNNTSHWRKAWVLQFGVTRAPWLRSLLSKARFIATT